jgi:hypothetical protein
VVPPLILEGDEDIRRFLAALKRKRLRSYAKGKMDAYRKEFKLDDGVRSILEDQRCIVSLA